MFKTPSKHPMKVAMLLEARRWKVDNYYRNMCGMRLLNKVNSIELFRRRNYKYNAWYNKFQMSNTVVFYAPQVYIM